MRKLILLAASALCLALFGLADAPAGMATPRYNAKGQLLRPADFRTWMFVGASLGLSYSEGAAPAHPRIHNVYMQPQAYQEFVKTGRFPEKTMFVLALYEPQQKKSINQNGFFSGPLVAQEVALKDKEHFPEGWAYFDFGGGADGHKAQADAFPKERCFACHQQHGAVDNVFLQFYPILRRVKDPGSEP